MGSRNCYRWSSLPWAKYLSTAAIFFRTVASKPAAVVLPTAKYGTHAEERLVAVNGDRPDGRDAAVERDREQRLLKVAIVGVPNAGKSSLINSVVQRNICPYSCKVHTTRASARAIQNVGSTQLVFLDTPGLVDSKEISKYNLEKAFANDSVKAIDEADIIGVIHDVSNRYTRHYLDPKVLRLLHLYPDKDSFLVLNKIDQLKSKSYLLDLARSLTCFKNKNFHVPEPYIMSSKEKEADKRSKVQERMLNRKIKQSNGWGNFSDVFMVSAVLNHGTSDIKEYLLQKSKPSPWIFSEDRMSDKEDYELVLRIIESRLYDNLPNEVPYNLKVELEYYEVSCEGNIHVVVLVHCNTPRIEKLVMGKKGQLIRHIARSSEQLLRDTFLTDVFLKMVVTDKLKNLKSEIND